MSKPLKFFHVPKTAGTSIQQAAQRHRIKWSYCDPDFHIKWNTPGSVDHQPFYQASNPRLYQRFRSRYTYFCVVRNPYERCISNYYCSHAGPSNKDNSTVEEFNEYIRSKIIPKPISDHWCPQSLFVYHHDFVDNVPIQKEQIIQYVLKYENLDVEFANLMKKYRLPVVLSLKLNVGNKKYSVDDMDSKTIRLINEFYQMDFINFGYPMISDVEMINPDIVNNLQTENQQLTHISSNTNEPQE